MKVRSLQMLAMGVLAGAAISVQADVTVHAGNSTTPWLGFMNVTELPENGGAYVFGSGWGVPDLVAAFDDGSHNVSLKPNSVNDPNPFWYLPAGGPGAMGNKQMDANCYYEVSDGSMNGVKVTFSGTVISNTLAASHVATIFIKDFAPDYSSNNSAIIPVVPGAFSFSLDTDPDPARHVQWGFTVVGPCVWITDIAPYGSAVISTSSGPACPGDLNNDQLVDDADFVIFAAAYNLLDCTDPTMPAGCPADLNGDGFVDDSDFVIFVGAYNALICP
ncbi:MAG: hypothetical protein ACREJD_16980 [Phycisphaerales bacterium]